jgi:hypothetical protein
MRLEKEIRSQGYAERDELFCGFKRPVLFAQTRGRIALICLLAASVSCQTQPALPKGPQPFLIISVASGNTYTAGTLAPKIDFDFWRSSENRADVVSMRATLVETTPSGFRISWNAQKTVSGNKIVNHETQRMVPWGKFTTLDAVPGYSVEAFYSPVTADKLNP